MCGIGEHFDSNISAKRKELKWKQKALHNLARNCIIQWNYYDSTVIFAVSSFLSLYTSLLFFIFLYQTFFALRTIMIIISLFASILNRPIFICKRFIFIHLTAFSNEISDSFILHNRRKRVASIQFLRYI